MPMAVASPIKAEVVAPFVKAVKETFLTMMEMPVRRCGIHIKHDYLMFGEITGVIGLSGVVSGTCAISMPGALAIDAVGRMLGEDLGGQFDQQEVRDGVGEMINMVAGRAKGLLSTTPYKFDITLPTIISGERHEVFLRKGTACIVLVFETKDGARFTLDLSLAQRNR